MSGQGFYSYGKRTCGLEWLPYVAIGVLLIAATHIFICMTLDAQHRRTVALLEAEIKRLKP